MDAAGHGHRIDKSMLPLKKRASNYTSPDDPYASSPSKKKRRIMADNSVVVVAETKNLAGASEDRALAVSESDEEEKKRLSKAKWLAKEDQSPVTPHPPVAGKKKLMHDGIRSFVPQHQQLRDEHRRRQAAASPVLSEALERRLAELGATRPWLVHRKALHKSDVDENQNRLLVSRKRGTERGCPITRCFSRAELARVHNKHAGLAVTAFDRDGVPYALACKFLTSNKGYRFITDWKHFLIRNGLNLRAQRRGDWRRDVEVELWAFRSRRLPFQPQLGADGKPVTVNIKGEDGKEVAVVQLISHHLHPDGSLGLLLLHHERVRSQEDQDDGDGDRKLKQGPSSRPRPVARMNGNQQSGKRGASASPVAEQGGSPPRHDAAFLVSTFYAAVGLVRLRESILERWREYVDHRADGAKGLPNDVAKSPADVSADVEGEKVKKQKSPETHSIKELGASSSSQPIGNDGNKTSTEEDNGALEVPRFHHVYPAL